jgi:hypothetical protein
LVVDRPCPFACCDGIDWRCGGQDVRDGLELQTRADVPRAAYGVDDMLPNTALD